MTAMEELLFWAKTSNHPLYERAIIENYIKEHGEHYDEAMATEAVTKMHSKSGVGEHWTIDQIAEAVKPYADKLGKCDTIWDVYVALNAWWHDMSRIIPAEDLIPTGITFFFEDEDAPSEKVWKYMHAL